MSCVIAIYSNSALDPLRLSFGFWNNKGKTLVHLDYRWTIDRLLAGIRRTPRQPGTAMSFSRHTSRMSGSLSLFLAVFSLARHL